MHLKQQEATKCDKPIRVLFWGNRVGKTEWGGQESARFTLGMHPYRTIDIPNEGWVACPSFDLQLDGTQKKLEKYLGPQLIEHVDYLRSSIWKLVRLKNGSLITFKSYEQGREKFQSAGKRWIWFDEEPPSDIYQECVVRQEAGIPLDIWITMTPVNGMTWIYDDIFLDTSNPYLYTSEAEWNDNPFLEQTQKDMMERQIKTDESLSVRRFGRFVARVGLVCSWWRREKHLKDYTEFPRNWSYYEVLDGGWSDPSAWLLLAFDTDNNLHILDGFREKELNAGDIKQKRDTKMTGLLIRSGYCDNDNPRLTKDLNDLGMHLKSVEKQAHESASWDQTLTEAITEYGKIQKGTGEPRLFVNNSLTWFIQEIENLKWLEVEKKQGVEIKPAWDDHRRFGHHFDGMRALGYFAVSYKKPVNDYEDIPDDTQWVAQL